MNSRRLTFLILIPVFLSLALAQCSNPTMNEELGDQIKLIPLENDWREKNKSAITSEFGCFVSTLNKKEADHKYLYQNFYVEYPVRILKEAKGKIITKGFSLLDPQLNKKTPEFIGELGTGRFLMCKMPDSPSAVAFFLNELKKFGRGSWIDDLPYPPNSEKSKLMGDWVMQCELKHTWIITINEDPPYDVYYYKVECGWVFDPDANEEGGFEGGGSGGGGGGDPGGDCENPWDLCIDGPTGPEPVDPVDDPCDHADQLETDFNFKQHLNDLKINSTLYNHETGYVYRLDPPEYVYIEGEDNDPEINFILHYDEKIDGIQHSHFDGALSIFSPKDFHQMYHAFENNYMNHYLTYTNVVYTASGTSYILKIEDVDKFASFGNSYLDNEAAILEQMYVLYSINTENSAAINEENLLKVLQITDSGMKLFKGNSNLSSWTPLGLDTNGNVTTVNCN